MVHFGLEFKVLPVMWHISTVNVYPCVFICFCRLTLHKVIKYIVLLSKVICLNDLGCVIYGVVNACEHRSEIQTFETVTSFGYEILLCLLSVQYTTYQHINKCNNGLYTSSVTLGSYIKVN